MTETDLCIEDGCASPRAEISDWYCVRHFDERLVRIRGTLQAILGLDENWNHLSEEEAAWEPPLSSR